MLHESIYMTFWTRQNYRDRNQVRGCQGLECGGDLRVLDG